MLQSYRAIWQIYTARSFGFKATRPEDTRLQGYGDKKAMRLHNYMAIWLYGYCTLFYMLYKIYSTLYTLYKNIYIIHCYGY